MEEISPTFCMAKWHHTTIYLQTGETHSCYHPAPHAIPLKEIMINPNALHNTQQKISERAVNEFKDFDNCLEIRDFSI